MPPRARSQQRIIIDDDDDDDNSQELPTVQQPSQEVSQGGDESVDQAVRSVFETNSASMKGLFRGFTGFCAEADVVASALKCDRFLRAYEAATFDGAVIRTGVDLNQFPTTNSTDRLYTAVDQLGQSDDPILGLLDVKSFQWKAMYEQRADVNLPLKLYNAFVSLSEEQFENCEALIISSISDPEWVAFLPRAYFRKPQKEGRRYNLYSGCTHPANSHMSPLPPVYAPFVMHRDRHLPEALQNLADRLSDDTIELYNPFTKIPYTKQTAPQLQPFSVLAPPDSSEWVVRRKLWETFSTTTNTGLRMVSPTHAPLTSDVCLVHDSSSTTVFVELKFGSVQVREQDDGTQLFKHRASHPGNTKARYFNFKAPFDFFCTMVNRQEGYLILKDDIPFDFWHQEPGEDDWLSHVLDDNTFLSARHIRLDQPVPDIANRISDIVKGTGAASTDPPRKARLTAEDIIRRAGPCPVTTIIPTHDLNTTQTTNTQTTGTVQSTDEDEEDTQEGSRVAQAEADGNDDDDDGAHGEPPNDAAATQLFQQSGHMRGVFGTRQRILGGNSLPRTAELTKVLMRECRATGRGCIIDLGKNHPMGTLGFVRCVWTQDQKDAYDRSGRPPYWFGNLPTSIVMIPLALASSRWQKGYAPQEPTQGEIQTYRYAHPCLVVCIPLPRETDHLLTARWLIPSEYMPKVNIGNLKSPGNKSPLFLENKMDVEAFMVTNRQTHTMLWDCTSGKDEVTYGLGQVKIDPRQFWKSTREYKVSADINFGICISGSNARAEKAKD